MKKKFNYKVLIIILLTILVFMYLIIFNIKKNTKVEIKADIVRIGTNYVIVADSDDNEYKINTNEEYHIGDKIKVTMKNIKKGNPSTGEIIKIDIVSRNVSFTIEDNQIDNKEESNITNVETTTNSNDTNNSSNNSTNKNTNSNNTVTSNITTDEQVIAYLNNFETEVDENNNLKDTIKEKFIIMVDFLFYDGKIGNKTFDELSNATKLKVLEIALSIDQKIENKFPGYKESISTNGKKIYTNVKSKVVESYLNITTSVCENNQELCTDAKTGLGELKTSFSLTWDFIKEISGIGLDKLKSWYEVWKTV